jgi:hypothetical protein
MERSKWTYPRLVLTDGNRNVKGLVIANNGRQGAAKAVRNGGTLRMDLFADVVMHPFCPGRSVQSLRENRGWEIRSHTLE